MRTYTAILTALLLTVAPVFAQTATPAKPAATMPAQTMPAQTMPAKTMPAATPAKMMAPVAVNTATAAQLSAIPGVGPKMAAALIAARPFKNSADLIKRVKGIGPKNYVSLHLDKALTY